MLAIRDVGYGSDHFHKMTYSIQLTVPHTTVTQYDALKTTVIGNSVLESQLFKLMKLLLQISLVLRAMYFGEKLFELFELK